MSMLPVGSSLNVAVCVMLCAVTTVPAKLTSAVTDDSPVVSWAADFKSKFPEADVAGLPIEIYEHQLWGNGFHLNLAGADVFTQQVGQNVMDYLK